MTHEEAEKEVTRILTYEQATQSEKIKMIADLVVKEGGRA